MAEDIVRVLRILEYVGPRSWVEQTLARTAVPLNGQAPNGRLAAPWTKGVIRSAMLGSFPEILERAQVEAPAPASDDPVVALNPAGQPEERPLVDEAAVMDAPTPAIARPGHLLSPAHPNVQISDGQLTNKHGTFTVGSVYRYQPEIGSVVSETLYRFTKITPDEVRSTTASAYRASDLDSAGTADGGLWLAHCVPCPDPADVEPQPPAPPTEESQQ